VKIPKLSGEAEVLAWLAVATAQWGEYHEVAPMPFGMYMGREPLSELFAMAPHMKIIPIELAPED
jgi:hypothetical protein